MPLDLIRNHPQPELVQLDLTLSPDASGQQTELGCEIQLAPAWWTVATGRVQVALRSLQLVVQIPATAAVVTVHQEIKYLSTKSGDGQYHWSIGNAQGHLTPLTAPLLTLSAPCDTLQAWLYTDFPAFQLTEIEGLWPHDLSPNRLAVLNRAIAKPLWQAYGAALSAVGTQAPPSPVPPDLTAIPELIQRIVKSPSDRFADLVTLTDLDLSQDFAQSNLLGVNLREADLNKVNLAGANLRGAELCDADLREANLENANLQGADCSGALLEEANLDLANGYRASFALANFSGASLKRTNFQATNLTQTTWHGATVTQLALGENQGLSEQNQAWLLQQGAIAH
ncbi:MAG: pentapeptide repeat-containing protein [Spirulina sp. SIO3F2]|nr:pentapeptide repeat-containing protein [Spirulina sp. SIO3F2]